MKVEVISKGLFSLIVDEGRIGKQRQGFSQSGPMDEMAYHWANFLAHNPDNTPCLEVMGKMTVCFHEPAIVAVAGRQVTVQVNGHDQPSYSSIKVNKNDRLSFQSGYVGSKAYLAIYGEWKIPHQVGSACTVVRESLGGLHGDGRGISDGDCIDISRCDEQTYEAVSVRQLPIQNSLSIKCGEHVAYDIEAPLRVIKGYQEAHFSQVAKRMFESSEYTVSSSIDRMGYRLNGADIASSLSSMRSEAIHIGAIQVPPDGQPIIMMRDRQTLGGYPKLGCLNPLDVSRLAQRVPGETVSFIFQNSEEARADILLSRQHVQRLRGEIA
ncbi:MULTISPECIES: biotin-dependent carboxyltransferase family protein [unclassified Alteromonas]|uniref:5-oxoprolinase subunit C family protein n=1 Tax=unclassified Alteromonas TaxID=2614992 RepID=UPI000509F0BE|nr:MULTISPECIES: biotin-dependent carboxyltransferase family protein [unclassified Alteromonas]